MFSVKSTATALSLGVAAAFIMTAPSHAGVMISSSSITASADDGDFSSVTDTFTGTAIPASQTLSATDGATTNTTQVGFSTGGNMTTLSIQVNHARPADQFASGYSWGFTYFTVDVDSTYDLSGIYSVTDAGAAGTPGTVFFQSHLRDVTSPILPAQSAQQSIMTANESFTLGLSEGDFSNVLNGSLTGTLIAGRTYEWYFDAATTARPADITPATDMSATATGSLTLKIGSAAAVPEPGTLALFGLGLVGLGFARRRKGA